MKVPEWLHDTRLSVLHERVENLPLEKLRLGQRTFRSFWQATALSLASSLVCPTLMTQVFHLPGAGLTAGALLFLVNGFLFFSTTEEGWSRAKEDSPAYSFHRCEALNATWVLALVTACIGVTIFLMLLVGVTALVSGNPPLQSLKGGVMIGGLMVVIYLPNYAIRMRGELLRALLGLLNGTGRRVTSRRRERTVLERLVRPDGHQGVPGRLWAHRPLNRPGHIETLTSFAFVRRSNSRRAVFTTS